MHWMNSIHRALPVTTSHVRRIFRKRLPPTPEGLQLYNKQRRSPQPNACNLQACPGARASICRAGGVLFARNGEGYRGSVQ